MSLDVLIGRLGPSIGLGEWLLIIIPNALWNARPFTRMLVRLNSIFISLEPIDEVINFGLLHIVIVGKVCAQTDKH